jgi:hypothetical protein
MRLLKILMVTALMCAVSARVDAQQHNEWEISVAPLYFWATALDGDLSAGPATVPVFLNFADAADNLGGAFSFHFEASRGRWGVLTDLNFIRLSSSSSFTVLGRTIEGEFEFDNVMFEVGGTYLVNEGARLGIIGGLRTYTVSPKLEFRGPETATTPIDTSTTSPNAFVGFIIRPRITDKWTFLARGDVGAGDADFTWSSLVGLEYRVARWGGLDFGFKALGIDVKSDDRVVREYDVTHYGPIVGFRFHWGQ